MTRCLAAIVGLALCLAACSSGEAPPSATQSPTLPPPPATLAPRELPTSMPVPSPTAEAAALAAFAGPADRPCAEIPGDPTLDEARFVDLDNDGRVEAIAPQRLVSQIGEVIEYAVLAPIGNCGWAQLGQLRQGSYRDQNHNVVHERWTCAGEVGYTPSRVSLVQVIEQTHPAASAQVRQFSFVDGRYVAHQATTAEFADAERAYSPEPDEQRDACLQGSFMQYETKPIAACGSANWTVDIPAGWQTTVVGPHSCETFHTTSYGMPCQCAVIFEIEITLVDEYVPDDAATSEAPTIEHVVVAGFPALKVDQQVSIFHELDWTRTYAIDTGDGVVVMKAQAHESSLEWPDLAASLDHMAASLDIFGLASDTASVAPTASSVPPHPASSSPVLGVARDAVYTGGEQIWVGLDRGTLWQPVPLPGDVRVRSDCAMSNDDVVVATAFELVPDALPDQYLAVLGPDGDAELVPLPTEVSQDDEQPWFSMYCRPASIDGQWTAARTDGSHLVVATTSDQGGSFTVHRLPFDFEPGSDAAELVKQSWQDGHVSLFADGDWYVARVCAVRESICVMFDFSFHASLVGDRAVDPTASLFRWRADVSIPDNGTTIFEIGGEAWRIAERRLLVAGDPEFLNDAIVDYAAGPVVGPATEIGAPPSRGITLFPGSDGSVLARMNVARSARSGVHQSQVEWWRGNADWEWELVPSPVVNWSQLDGDIAVTVVEITTDGAVQVIAR